MKTPFTFPRARQSERAGVSLRSLLLLCGIAFLPLVLAAVPPAWWQTRGVLDANQQADDYAAINTGQLKHIAKQAMLELDAKIPGGAGAAIHQMIDAWPGQTTGRDDFAAVNIGQLKAVAKLFYDRLNQAGYTQPYPWSDSAPDRVDFAGVNVGQVKAVFTFCVICAPTDDTDADGLPDWWEIQHFGNLGQASSGNADQNSLTKLEEYLLGTNPNASATLASSSALGLAVFTPLSQ